MKHNDDDDTKQNSTKFIGGAEKARRRAQNFFKKNGISPHQKRQQKLTHNAANNTHITRRFALLSKRMKSSERFYAALLQHDVDSILQSSEHDGVYWKTFMMETCESLSIPIPAMLPKSFRDRNEYYTLLSSLVMEESRYILSDALKKQRGYGSRSGSSIVMNLMSAQKRESTGFISMIFAKPNNSRDMNSSSSRNVLHDAFSYHHKRHDIGSNLLECCDNDNYASFTTKELFDMKPGCVFEVIMMKSNNHRDKNYETSLSAPSSQEKNISFLATVIPKAKHSANDGISTLPLLMFQKTPFENELLQCAASTKWKLVPITSLISEQRQFDACMKAPNVSFMNKIIGMKSATHIRFDDSDDDVDVSDCDDDVYSSLNNNKDKDDKNDESDETDSQSNNSSSLANKEENNDCQEWLEKKSHVASICIPPLNDTQEKAAQSFLSSSPSTISLVQGPPGMSITLFIVLIQFQ